MIKPNEELRALAEKLEQRAEDAIWAGAAWWSTDDIAQRNGLPRMTVHTQLTAWEERRLLFALERAGEKLYPSYAFAEDLSPLPAVGVVLDILQCSAGAAAAFFESTSSYLGGCRPRELLASDPERVVAKARYDREAMDYCG